MLKRENRFVVLLTDDETEQLQEFRWQHRLESKGEAARVLIAEGLKAKNEKADAEPASA